MSMSIEYGPLNMCQCRCQCAQREKRENKMEKQINGYGLSQVEKKIHVIRNYRDGSRAVNVGNAASIAAAIEIAHEDAAEHGIELGTHKAGWIPRKIPMFPTRKEARGFA